MDREINTEKIQKFVDSVEWRFAKSMPEIPHEYIVTDQYLEKSAEIKTYGYTKDLL